MLEIPEIMTIVQQLNSTIIGKEISKVIVNASEHKFAFFYEDPKTYPNKLRGKKIEKAYSSGAFIEIEASDVRLTFADGANLRYYPNSSEIPAKHQLLLGFSDDSALVVSVQMYGFIAAFKEGEYSNPYYLSSKTKPSPLSPAFSFDYFMKLVEGLPDHTSLKGFLATEQRIPGLGNGVLQDILFNAKLHPKFKVATLNMDELKVLYISVKETLTSMTEKGGRDTEKNLFGKPGQYHTIMSAKHKDEPCPTCSSKIIKEAYMGGSIYTCPKCQSND